MGANCFREQQGDMLPADSQSDAGREELERQESVMQRQETELTEKQTRYLALLSQLEEEKAKVATARKDLSEALSESEIFKSTIKELSARLRDCESTVNHLKVAQEEYERLSQRVDSEESENSFETELETTKAQVKAAAADLERAKAELDSQQRKLRKTEASIQLLEKLELEMERELGEEVSKHEGARRKAYLRGLFLFVLRRIHALSLRGLMVWHMNAQACTSRHESALVSEVASFRQRVAALPPIPALPSIESAAPLHTEVRTALAKLTQTQDLIHRVRVLADDKLSAFLQQFANDESELKQAAESEACSSNLSEIRSHLAALEDMATIYQRLTQAIPAHKAGIDYIREREAAVADATRLLDSVEADILHFLAANALKSPIKEEADELLRQVTVYRKRIDTDSQSCKETLQILQKERGELEEIEETVRKQDVQGGIELLESWSKSAQVSIELRSKELIEEEMMGESTAVEETEVAAAAESSPEVPLSLPDLEALLPIEAEEIRNSPTLRILLSAQPVDAPLLSLSELDSFLAGFFSSLGTAHPSPRVSVSLADYLLTKGLDARREVPHLAASFAQQSGAYLQLISRALGLSVTEPIADFRAKAVVLGELAVRQEAARMQKTRHSGTDALAEDGGSLPLLDAIKAIYRLFDPSAALGEVALESLRPGELPLLDYLNFVTCVRLKDLGKESLQLFKIIDQDGSGKLDRDEFAAGLRENLKLWAKAEHIYELYARIDKDRSGSISRFEFTREINFKEYFQKAEAYTVTKLQYLRAVDQALQFWTETVLKPALGTAHTEDALQLVLSRSASDQAALRNSHPEKFAVHSDDLLSAATRELLQQLEAVAVV